MKLLTTSTLLLGITLSVFSGSLWAVTTQHYKSDNRDCSEQKKRMNILSHVKHTNKKFKNSDEICVSCGGAGF